MRLPLELCKLFSY